MIALDDARRRVTAAIARLPSLAPERVPLADALGRTLAEDLRAPHDLPPFAASTMDGYALRAADAAAPGARLPVAFDVYAGRPARGPLPPGACCRIATGAAIPSGADAVERQEDVRRRGATARFTLAVPPGRFVRAPGSDLRAGAIALSAGTTLDPAMLGLAAALGRATVPVRRRPIVAILPTGDELAPPGRPLRRGEIRESNSAALAAAVREAGGEPRVLPPAADRADALARALRRAREADVLVTVGGVSVGDRDLVREALQRAGARLDFWRVAVRPGKPFTFGLWNDVAVFGLPGNPASALVTFELFVRPAVRARAGLAGDGRARLWARLAAAVEKPAELAVLLRVRLGAPPATAGLPWAAPLPTQRSGDHASLASADALALLPAGRTRLRRGAAVQALLLRPPDHHDA
jgi:molybdopterin molybdotransferase